jgi:hypothetical protein
MYNIITDDAQLQQQKWRKSNVVDRRTPRKKDKQWSTKHYTGNERLNNTNSTKNRR